jgi:hypothetical protein
MEFGARTLGVLRLCCVYGDRSRSRRPPCRRIGRASAARSASSVVQISAWARAREMAV